MCPAKGARARCSRCSLRSSRSPTLLREHGLDLVIANKNAPRQCVLSGPAAEIERAQRLLEDRGLTTRSVPVSAAFHSPAVASAEKASRRGLDSIPLAASAIPVFSNATAEPYPDEPDAARALLAGQLARPVEFVAQIEAMYRMGARTFLEVGPDAKLTGLVRAILEGRDHLALAVDAARGSHGNLYDLACSLATLASAGYAVDLTRWDEGRHELGAARRKVRAHRQDLRCQRQTESVAATTTRSWTRNQPGLREYSCTTPGFPPVATVLDGRRKKSDDVFASSAARSHRDRLDHELARADQLALTRTARPPRTDTSAAKARRTADASAPPVDRQRSSATQAGDLPWPCTSARQPAGPRSGWPNRRPPCTGSSWKGKKRPSRSFSSCSTRNSDCRLAALDSTETRPWPERPPALRFNARLASSTASTPVDGRPPSVSPAVHTQWKGASHRRAHIAGVSRPSRAPASRRASAAGESAAAILIDVVAEKTGYPAGVLDLDMQLDADLGIDSIKRVEILSALQDRLPGLPGARARAARLVPHA